MEDIQFISYPLKKIYPDMELPGDIYIFIGGKFIKYKNSGDPLPTEKYEQFLLKRVQFLFINQADLAKYNTGSQAFLMPNKKKLSKKLEKRIKKLPLRAQK
jgi:hypothetical protein